MEGILNGEKLIEAIALADEPTLRAVLRGLCAEREVEQLVGKHLYEVNKLNAAKGILDPNGKRRLSFISASNVARLSRKMTMRRNVATTQEMELDEDSSTWDDYDENYFGLMDSEENRRNPDTLGGFVYPCCDKRADESEGCKLGYHRAVDGKRGRFDVDDSADEEDDGENKEGDDEEQEENE